MTSLQAKFVAIVSLQRQLVAVLIVSRDVSPDVFHW